MDKWYADRRLLRAAYEQHGTLQAAAEALGGADATTLAKWWRRHRLEPLSMGPRPKVKRNEEEIKKLQKSVYG